MRDLTTWEFARGRELAPKKKLQFKTDLWGRGENLRSVGKTPTSPLTVGSRKNGGVKKGWVQKKGPRWGGIKRSNKKKKVDPP